MGQSRTLFSMPFRLRSHAGTNRMNRRLLVIEDDRDTLANLCDILELDGYAVTGVDSLAKAARLNWADYSVILLDRKLPDGTADEILPQIRRRAPRAAVIVITGYADLQSTISAIRAGAADYLLKPIQPELLQATVERSIRIQRMETQLVQSERLAAIGQMMAVLTHESRNILNRGNAALEMLEMDLEGTPAALEYIARIKKSHNDLTRLHEEVRNYAAPIELECADWDLASLWRQTWANLLKSSCQGNGAELREAVDGVDLKCEVDGFRLDQVFHNLFENSLAACRGPARIEVACCDDELGGKPALRIVVRDNGPGLKAEDAQRIFMPFYTTKPKGTGLGLAIVSRILEAHGGAIFAQSSPGGGAEFVLTLPRSQKSVGDEQTLRSHGAAAVGCR